MEDEGNAMTKKQIYRWVTGVLLAGWMLVIFLFSAQPAVDSDRVSGTVAYKVAMAYNEVFDRGLTDAEMERCAENINVPIRKIAHMTEYAVCGILVFAVLAGYFRRGGKMYAAALLFTVLYSVTDELHQRFVPGRAGRLADVCIDTIGVVLGLFLLFVVLKVYGKHCEKKKLPLQ